MIFIFIAEGLKLKLKMVKKKTYIVKLTGEEISIIPHSRIVKIEGERLRQPVFIKIYDDWKIPTFQIEGIISEEDLKIINKNIFSILRKGLKE